MLGILVSLWGFGVIGGYGLCWEDGEQGDMKGTCLWTLCFCRFCYVRVICIFLDSPLARQRTGIVGELGQLDEHGPS
jgi:hypothetical protein